MSANNSIAIDIESLDILPFDASFWIGTGKIYPTDRRELPNELLAESRRLERIQTIDSSPVVRLPGIQSFLQVQTVFVDTPHDQMYGNGDDEELDESTELQGILEPLELI